MEINAANVAQHIFFFVGSRVLDEKIKIFGELSTEEIQNITDSAIIVTTKKP